MKRREFTLGVGAAACVIRPAVAADPVEGKDYTVRASPLPVAVPGKVEVLEFFGYWCPHCRALEPHVEDWAARLPGDVVFRRVPVSWKAMHEPYQKLFYALEALGLPAAIHRKVFEALHAQGLRLDTDAGLAAFAGANGIDKARLGDAMKGFSVTSKARIATQLFRSYGLDGVPTFAVQGRFVTSPQQAGGDARALQVVDALIVKARSLR